MTSSTWPRSLRPEVLDHHAVAALGAVGADRDDLEPLRPCPEAADDVGRDAHHVPLAQVVHLVVEPNLAGSADDDVDLLLLAMVVAHGRPEVSRIAEVGDAEMLGLEPAAAHVGLDAGGLRGLGRL